MICANQSCSKAGIDQPAENFNRNRGVCKECQKKRWQEWELKNREQYRERRRVINDDDPETDLVPDSLGSGQWSRITR